MSLKTDADLVGAAAAGELWLVEDNRALKISQWPSDHADRGYGLGDWGVDWVLVRALTAGKAIAIAGEYDHHPTLDLRDADHMAVVEDD